MKRSMTQLMVGCAGLSLVLMACSPADGQGPEASSSASTAAPSAPDALPTVGSRAKPQPTAVVRRDALTESVLLDGTVAARELKPISPSWRSSVVDVLVKPGQAVRQGEVLLTIEAPHHVTDYDLVVQLEGARARLAAAEAKIAGEQAAGQDRQQEATRQSHEIQQQQQHEIAKAALDLREAQEKLAKVQAGASAIERQTVQDVVTAAQRDLQRALDSQAKLTSGPDPAAIREAERAAVGAQAGVNKARTDLSTLTTTDPGALREAEVRLQRAQTELQAVMVARPDRTLDQNVARIQQEAATRDAQRAVQDAQERLDRLKQPAPAFEVQSARQRLADAEEALLAAQARVRALQSDASQTSLDTAQAAVDHARQALALAEARGAQVLNRPTPGELAAASDEVRRAQMTLDNARQARPVNLSTDSSTDFTALLEAQAEIDNVERALGRTRITAPFDGSVVTINVKVADIVSSNTVLVLLANAEPPQVQAELNEDQVGLLSVGKPATIVYEDEDATPVTVIGTVRDIVRSNDGNNRATADIVVSWPGNQTPPLGSPAQVAFALRHKQDVLVIPKSAVRQLGERATVQVLDGTRRRSVSVKVGITNAESAEIVSGLAEGQQVLLSAY